MYNHMHSQRDGPKLELKFKKEAGHKSLENLQPDHVVEKKNIFSGENFKLSAAEIFINNEGPQDNGENISRAFQRFSQQPLPSQAQRPRREKWFCGPGSGPCCSVQSWNTTPCNPAAPAPAVGAKLQLGPLFQRDKPKALAAYTWCWAYRHAEGKN
uniref:Uncharacterized protein n=2 Tax=Macaca TaxID=9539 RepID=A0A5F7ZIH3_MACMU